MIPHACALVGAERVREQVPIMTAEDFSFMLEQVPGSYSFPGNGGGHRDPGHGDGPCLVHNSGYDFNDALLPVGARYWHAGAPRRPFSPPPYAAHRRWCI